MSGPSYQTCRLCKQRYDETNHVPKLLPCGHCLCSYCLSAVTDNTLKSCPECRSTWRHSNAASFPTVFKLIEYSTGASEVTSEPTYRACNVCSHTFNNDDLKPRLLPCGHVACHSCLQSINASGQAGKNKCPQCTHESKDSIDNLPVVKDLIPPGANITKKNIPGLPAQRYQPQTARSCGASDIQGKSSAYSDDDPKKQARVYVKNMAGSGIRQMFNVNLNDTVHTLCLQIQRVMNIRAEEQSLMHEHQYMERTRTLGSYNVREGSEIILTCRLRGG